MALSVISTSIAKMCSCKEKHRSAGVMISSSEPLRDPFWRYRLSVTYASTEVRIPDRLTSIPLVVYGSGSKRWPLALWIRSRPNGFRDLSLFGLLLDVVPWTWVIAQVYDSRKAIEAVSNSYVKCFPKNSIALLGVCDNLGIAAGNIEHHRVLRPSDVPTHFYVCTNNFTKSSNLNTKGNTYDQHSGSHRQEVYNREGRVFWRPMPPIVMVHPYQVLYML